MINASEELVAKPRIVLEPAMIDALGSSFAVRVTPGAAREEIRFVADGEAPLLKVGVTAIAEGGKANDAVIRLVAKAMGLAPSRLRIVRGQTARLKWFEVDG